jgi:hypothetical protein
MATDKKSIRKEYEAAKRKYHELGRKLKGGK